MEKNKKLSPSGINPWEKKFFEPNLELPDGALFYIFSSGGKSMIIIK